MQRWQVNASASTLVLASTAGAGESTCMDIKEASVDINATVYTFPCAARTSANQQWAVGPESVRSLDPGGKCLRAGYTPGGVATVGEVVTTAVCDSSDPLQALAFDSASGLIQLGASGLCVDAGTAVPWCASLPRSNWTICDPTAGADVRVADLVSRLSLDDTIAALDSGGAMPSVGLPGYSFWNEATHGVSTHYTADIPAVSNTAFPILTSCAFNRSLWRATGNTIGREARALHNDGVAAQTFWAPVVNIVREPRESPCWGSA